MLTIIIGAVVSLLIFFFEQWWKNHHASPPTSQTRQAFIALVNSKWRFKLIPQAKREALAGQAHDQFAANYAANPPVFDLSDAPLTADQAKALAQKYAQGIVLQ